MSVEPGEDGGIQRAATLPRGAAATLQRGAATPAAAATAPKTRKCNVHCNSLWSLWYGLAVLALQAYIIYKCVTRFLMYISLPWPEEQQPYLELNLYVGLVGAGVVLLPFFFISFMFKIGNLANDGYKLGYSLSTCSMDPPSVLAKTGGFIGNAWHHGGPTGPFIHIVSAFCFLLPRIIIESKLIEVGFLSRESIWTTDLDWMVPNNDRMIVLSFFTGSSAINNPESTTVGSPVSHPADQIRQFLETDTPWTPFSAEFLNYALALLVYAVRYPAVFWKTNKALSFLFSVQLVGNGLQSLMAFAAMSIMFKVHVIGPQNVLHKYEPFLLNPPICMLLYLLSAVIVTASSSVIYMYGYQKFMAFLNTEREKKTIILNEGKTSLWLYFPHTAAMCTLIALAVCNGPLLYDFTIIYKGSLDGTVLVFVIATVLHLFLWIVTWLFLTVKMTWKFKLRVTVGRAAVHNAKSIKLVNDIDLQHQPVDKETAPMLIVGFGKTFTVHDQAPKKLIMRTLAKAAMETDKALEEEETYWLKGDTPSQSHGGVGGGGGGSTNTILRVHASPSLNKRGGDTDSPPGQSPRRVTGQSSPLATNVQDSDDRLPKESMYGTIRMKGKGRPITEGESTQALNTVHNTISEEDVDSLPPPPLEEGVDKQTHHLHPRPAPRKGGHAQDVMDVHTPRSNRSIDSGLPDSSSTTSSTSPPGQAQPYQDQDNNHRKSTSLDNINLPGGGGVELKAQWKSYSLQRGAAPPGEEFGAGEEEDIYGRCTNIKLTTFSEQTVVSAPRDPRIIDLAQGTPPGAHDHFHGQAGAHDHFQQNGHGHPNGQHHPAAPPVNGQMPHQPNGQPPHNGVPQGYPPPISNPGGAGYPAPYFNTLPAGGVAPQPPAPHPQAHPHNTLPARVGESPPRTHAKPGPVLPSGRHFKPFDHRKMNPMADIQENPYEVQAAESTYGQFRQDGYSGAGVDTTYVVHHNTKVPYMPSELRHTNYGTKPQLVHPQVLQHRDSANYSLNSSDSGHSG